MHDSIKLNAWDGQKMHYDVTVYRDPKTGLYHILESNPFAGVRITAYNVTPLRFIGLYDAKNIEIYEGDIVEAWGGEQHQGMWEFNARGVIEYSKSASFDIVGLHKGMEVHYPFTYSNWDGCTVIGNRYENPKLLPRHP